MVVNSYSNSILTNFNTPLIYKLEQLRTTPLKTNNIKELEVSANLTFEDNILSKRERKQKTNELVNNILDASPNSKVARQLKLTFGCNKYLDVVDGKVKTYRCKNRWCSNCQRVQQNIYFQKYFDIIANWYDKWLITLTIPNIKQNELKATLDKFMKFIRKTNESRSFRSGRLIKQYIRKFEVTINKNTGELHPHLHLLVNSEESARYILKCWERFWKGTTSYRGQDIKRADNSTLNELVKYLTKMNDVEDYKALNNIYEVMKGRRILSAVGIKANEVQQISNKTTQIPNGYYEWSYKVNDWLEINSNLLLCGNILNSYSDASPIIENAKVFFDKHIRELKDAEKERNKEQNNIRSQREITTSGLQQYRQITSHFG